MPAILAELGANLLGRRNRPRRRGGAGAFRPLAPARLGALRIASDCIAYFSGEAPHRDRFREPSMDCRMPSEKILGEFFGLSEIFVSSRDVRVLVNWRWHAFTVHVLLRKSDPNGVKPSSPGLSAKRATLGKRSATIQPQRGCVTISRGLRRPRTFSSRTVTDAILSSWCEIFVSHPLLSGIPSGAPAFAKLASPTASRSDRKPPIPAERGANLLSRRGRRRRRDGAGDWARVGPAAPRRAPDCIGLHRVFFR